MAYVEEAFYDRLANDIAVSIEVGTRIFPKRAPKGTAYPLVIYEKVSGVRVNDHDGTDLAAPRMSARCYATTYAGCVRLANAVRVALSNFVGAQLGVSMSIHVANEIDLPFAPEENAYGRLVDFIVHHNE